MSRAPISPFWKPFLLVLSAVLFCANIPVGDSFPIRSSRLVVPSHYIAKLGALSQKKHPRSRLFSTLPQRDSRRLTKRSELLLLFKNKSTNLPTISKGKPPSWRAIGSSKRERLWSLFTVLLSAATVAVLARPRPALAATSKATATATPLILALGWQHVISASALISIVGGLGLSRLGLRGLSRQLMVACARCTLQLQLLGGFILQWLLPPLSSSQQQQPWWLIASWILGVGIIGAQEAYGRLEYTYPGLRRHLTIAFLAGGISVLGYALVSQLFGTLQPWYQPQTLIPVAGMLFGNCLSAVTLGASSLTRAFATQQGQVELLLSRGASYEEAIFPLVRESVTTALTPTMNALSVTGIVHLPGMMTGQILAGQSPQQAAIYQTLIWFLIASVATTTIQLLVVSITGELVDKSNHRLQLSNFAVRTKTKGTSSDTVRPAVERSNKASTGTILKKVTAVPLSNHTTCDNETLPMFRVRNLQVDRAGLELSLDVHPGDRIGITGQSGIGKSQILRTLVGLEAIQQSTSIGGSGSSVSSGDAPPGAVMELHGTGLAQYSLPEWRTKICLVSQDRPTATGTPRDLFHQIRTFQTLKQNEKASSVTTIEEDEEETWNQLLPSGAAIMDRPWSTLSGGEAQRASLYIALTALKPDILLLDEMGSALDDATTREMEAALLLAAARGNSNCNPVTIIMVTHDRPQLDRFCTHHIDLGSLTY